MIYHLKVNTNSNGDDALLYTMLEKYLSLNSVLEKSHSIHYGTLVEYTIDDN